MNKKLGTASPPPETIHYCLVVIGKTHPTNVVGNPDVHVKGTDFSHQNTSF